MTACRDCIHYDVCGFEWCDSEALTFCKDFKDKSKFIELPCKVGDTVYYFCTTFGTVLPYFVETLNITYYDKNKVCYQYEANCYNNEENEIIDGIDFEPDDIGKIVFLTKEQAEQRLKELNE